MTNDILSPCNKKIYAQVPRYITKPLFSEHIWEVPSAKERKRATNRVWKGILGIRDLANIRCLIWENAKTLDEIRDLTTTREAGLAKIRAWDARFFCLSVGISGNRHDPRKRSSGKSESSRRAQNINRKGQSTS